MDTDLMNQILSFVISRFANDRYKGVSRTFVSVYLFLFVWQQVIFETVYSSCKGAVYSDRRQVAFLFEQY